MNAQELHELVRDRSRTHFQSGRHFIRGQMQAYRETRIVVAHLDERIRQFCEIHKARALAA